MTRDITGDGVERTGGTAELPGDPPGWVDTTTERTEDTATRTEDTAEPTEHAAQRRGMTREAMTAR